MNDTWQILDSEGHVFDEIYGSIEEAIEVFESLMPDGATTLRKMPI
jgi:hypothetical protein